MNKKIRQILAWICIILLGGMYLTTLILALLGYGIYSNLFLFSLLMTLFLPLFSWAIIFIYDRAAGKRAPGDPYNDNPS